MSYIGLYGKYDKKKQKVLNSRPTPHLIKKILVGIASIVVTSFLCMNCFTISNDIMAVLLQQIGLPLFCTPVCSHALLDADGCLINDLLVNCFLSFIGNHLLLSEKYWHYLTSFPSFPPHLRNCLAILPNGAWFQLMRRTVLQVMVVQLK